MKKQLVSILTAIVLIISAAAPASVYADARDADSSETAVYEDDGADETAQPVQPQTEAEQDVGESDADEDEDIPAENEPEEIPAGDAPDTSGDSGDIPAAEEPGGTAGTDKEDNEEAAVSEEGREPEDGAAEITDKDDPETENEEESDDAVREIGQCSIALSTDACFYSGKERKPSAAVTDGDHTLVRDQDYTLSYEDNINAGTAKVLITGIGGYTGTVIKEFTIKSKSLAGAGVSVSISGTEYFYTGAARKPSVSAVFNNITLKKDRDYTVTYRNNINAGTARVIIKGIGNYKGSVCKEFTIKRKSLNGSGMSVTLKAAAFTYRGYAIEPRAKITYLERTLKAGRDYIIEYRKNIKAGTAAAIISGTGNYKGKVKRTFIIRRKSLAEDRIAITLSGTSFEWTGEEIKPAVTVKHRSRKLTEGKDYEVTYCSNINAGTARVVIKGIGCYKGGVKKTFKITPYKDPDFSLKGSLVLTAEDANGMKNISCYDKEDGAHYLFLTRSTDVSSLKLHYTGAELVKASKGELDKIRHVITLSLTEDSGFLAVREKNGRVHRVRIYRSDLPNVCISLNGITLEEVNAGTKNDKHPGNSVIITDSSGKVNAEETESVELKGRGNTTWEASEKKPYQLKFSEKTEVLGMGQAKKWVLLANSFDDSLMKNKIAFETANEMSGWWACSFEYCDLWIDGQYLGNYIIGQKNEIGSSRLDLKDKNGILVEMDDAFWYLEDERDQIDTTYWGRHFVVSDVVDEDNFDSAVKCFKAGMNDLESFLSKADTSVPLSEIDRYIDVDDAAKYYIVNEFLDNRESFATSFYFYRDGYGDNIHVGPVWDFDSAFGATDYNYGPLGEGYKNEPFNSLIKLDSFRDYVADVYAGYDEEVFKEASKMVARIKTMLKRSAFMNYKKWDFLGKNNGKGCLYDLENTYGKAAARLADWLRSRYRCFNPAQTAEGPSLYTYLYGQTVTINIQNLLSYGYQQISAHIWNDLKGEDERKEFPMAYVQDHSYEVSVNLSLLGQEGLYHIEVFGTDPEGEEHAIASTDLKLKEVSKPDASVKKGLDGKMYISISGAAGISSPKAAVWGAADEQNDLEWYRMKNTGSGTFAAAVNQSGHKETGKYYFHIYGYNGGSDYVFLDAAAASIYKPTVKLKKTKFRYTGMTAEPEAVVMYGGKTLVQGTDYSIEYRNNIKTGTAYAIITGKGEYSGRAVESFLIIEP